MPTLAAMSNRTTFDPGTASVDQLAKAVGHHLCGWHYVELLLGMLMAFSIMGPALWLAWDYLWQQIERTKRQNAALVLDKLDGAALKRICGNVSPLLLVQSYHAQPTHTLLQASHSLLRNAEDMSLCHFVQTLSHVLIAGDCRHASTLSLYVHSC